MKSIFLVLTIAVTAILLVQNVNVYATGGGKDIAGLVMPMIDRTMQYIQEGNYDAALEELQTIQDELKDTFELED